MCQDVPSVLKVAKRVNWLTTSSSWGQQSATVKVNPWLCMAMHGLSCKPFFLEVTSPSEQPRNPWFSGGNQWILCNFKASQLAPCWGLNPAPKSMVNKAYNKHGSERWFSPHGQPLLFLPGHLGQGAWLSINQTCFARGLAWFMKEWLKATSDPVDPIPKAQQKTHVTKYHMKHPTGSSMFPLSHLSKLRIHCPPPRRPIASPAPSDLATNAVLAAWEPDNSPDP